MFQLPKPLVKVRFKPVGLIAFDVAGEPRTKRTGKLGLGSRGAPCKLCRRRQSFPTIQKHDKNEAAETLIRETFFSWFAESDIQDLVQEPWKGPFAYAHQYFFKMAAAEKKKYKGHDIALKLGKPDIDNLHKMTNDSLEGFVFANDSLGVPAYGEKFCVRDGVEFTRIRFLLLEEKV